MHEQPDQHFAAGMSALFEQARQLLQPGEDQQIIIMAVDKSDAEAIRAKYDPAPEEIEDDGNVVPLFGVPQLSGEDERRLARKVSAEILLDMAEAVERGEYRDVAVIASIERNQETCSDVATVFSPGVTDHLAVFLGGTVILKEEIMDRFSEEVQELEGDVE